ncbi:MAG: hypothetical protein LBT40_06085 [Deltaproteobacteria bacterium]|nr:hypothetical protein [Deltaproteobacteria bacterium]
MALGTATELPGRERLLETGPLQAQGCPNAREDGTAIWGEPRCLSGAKAADGVRAAEALVGEAGGAPWASR